MTKDEKNKVINISDFQKSDLEFDKKKVDLRTLKELVRSGLYKPNADKIAESMLEKSANKKNPEKDK